jgi:serine/threonine-protein kinase OSR1/STK39
MTEVSHGRRFSLKSSKDPKPKIYPTNAASYKIIECVGKGTEGTVWRAVCITHKVEVAVKIVDLEAMSCAALDDIRQQIVVMQLCNRHPNIVDFYTSFIDHHYLWVVMPFLAGGSCSDIMKYGFPYGIDEDAIRVILKGILQAIDYFHKNGRIHRDIKAGNILISDKGHVQVADFGVSAILAEQQQLRTTLCGTPCWMAPEVMLLALPKDGADGPVSGYGSAVDIWSFGITALELAKGKPPLADYPTQKIFSMVVQQPAPSLTTDDVSSTSSSSRTKFSRSFKDLVACCLQKDPLKRPTAEKLLKHKFFSKKVKKGHLVNSILSKLPPLGERVRMCMQPVITKLPEPQNDELATKTVWVFPREDAYDNDIDEEREKRQLRYMRSLQSMSSGTSFVSASFMSSLASSTSSDSWMYAEEGSSIEQLNYIFQNMECE